MSQLKEKLFIYSQLLLPQHFLSRCIGLLARCQQPYIKNKLITWFIQRYHVNMQEAKNPDPKSYANFNTFFTRELRADVRPLAQEPNTLICPVDGCISQAGDIKAGKLIQAKGFDFTVHELLGGVGSENFLAGKFTTLYLAPKDYHRIHMPCDGRLTKMVYIPGKLFSVNQTTANNIPQLFARNERVACFFETEFGNMVVVLVGAFFVASIATSWAGIITPPTKSKIITTDYDQPIHLKKGDLLGHFELGSTVIMLFPKDSISFTEDFLQSPIVKYGQAMAVKDQ